MTRHDMLSKIASDWERGCRRWHLSLIDKPTGELVRTWETTASSSLENLLLAFDRMIDSAGVSALHLRVSPLWDEQVIYEAPELRRN